MCQYCFKYIYNTAIGVTLKPQQVANAAWITWERALALPIATEICLEVLTPSNSQA